MGQDALQPYPYGNSGFQKVKNKLWQTKEARICQQRACISIVTTEAQNLTQNEFTNAELS